jgi:hypothetical protein
MAHNTVCKNKSTAISILEAITEYIKSDTQRVALKAVAEWIRENNFEDISRLNYKERRARSMEIEIDLRNSLSVEQRREKAAFYLEGI